MRTQTILQASLSDYLAQPACGVPVLAQELAELDTQARAQCCIALREQVQARLGWLDDTALLTMVAMSVDGLIGWMQDVRTFRLDAVVRDYLSATLRVMLDELHGRGLTLRYLLTVPFAHDPQTLYWPLFAYREVLEWLGLAFVSPQRIRVLMRPDRVLGSETLDPVDLDWLAQGADRRSALSMLARCQQRHQSVVYLDAQISADPESLSAAFRHCHGTAALVAWRQAPVHTAASDEDIPAEQRLRLWYPGHCRVH